jgi:hypothetical protein
LATQAIRNAAIDFCHASMLIQSLDAQDVVAGVSEYQINIPSSMVLSKVLGVMYIDTWLDPNTVESVRSGVVLQGGVGEATVTNAAPTVYFQKNPTDTTVSVYPVPATTTTNGLLIRAAFAPSRSASSVPDILFENWVEEIAASAVSRLMALPGQTFSNPALVGAYAGVASAGQRSATIEARTGRVAAASRVRLTRFA